MKPVSTTCDCTIDSQSQVISIFDKGKKKKKKNKAYKCPIQVLELEYFKIFPVHISIY